MLSISALLHTLHHLSPTVCHRPVTDIPLFLQLKRPFTLLSPDHCIGLGFWWPVGHSWDTRGSAAPAGSCAGCPRAAASQDRDRDEGAWASPGSSHGLSQLHFSELHKAAAADGSPTACGAPGRALASHPALLLHRIPRPPRSSSPRIWVSLPQGPLTPPSAAAASRARWRGRMFALARDFGSVFVYIRQNWFSFLFFRHR